MKVSVTLDFSDRERRALNHRLGRSGLATQAECRRWMLGTVRADLDIVVSDFDEECVMVCKDCARDCLARYTETV